MKKLFNKICLFLLVMTMSFAGMQSVLAVQLTKLGYTATGLEYINGVSTVKEKKATTFNTEEIGITTSAVARKNGVPNPSGKNSYKTQTDSEYYLHKTSDGMYLYCLDALLSSSTTLYVGRFFFTNQETLKPYKTAEDNLFDFMVLYVLKNGQDSDDKLVYFNKSTAVRIITTLFGWLKTDGTIPSDDFPTGGKGASYLRGAYDGMLLRWVLNDQSYFDSVYGDKRSYSTSDYYDAELAEAYNYLVSSGISKTMKDINKLKTYGAGYGLECTNGGTACLATAKQLVKDSFKAAVEYVKGGLQSSEIKEEHSVDLSPTTTSVGSKTIISKNVNHTLTLANVNNVTNPSFKITDIAFKEDLEKYGADKQPEIVKITIDDVNVCGNANDCKSFIGKNLLEGRTFTDTTIIKIVVNVSGYQGELKCGNQPMAYEVKYTTNVGETNNPLADEVGIVWRNIEDTKNANGQKDADQSRQRFLSYVGKDDKTGTDPGEMSGSFEAEVTLVDACTCEDLERECREEAAANGNSFSGPACQDLKNSDCGDCTWWDLVCDINPNDPECNEDERVANCTADCKASFETYWCCDEQGEIATLRISTVDDKEVNIKGVSDENDIKACFVTKVDAMAKNSSPGNIKNDAYIEGTVDSTSGDDSQSKVTYTLGSMKSNRFCTVSCKEDYLMTMPTAKLVSAGRYFTFKAKINGTKTCYTDTINNELFEQEIEAAQKAMIDKFNIWSELNALATTKLTGTYTESYDHRSASYNDTCPTKLITDWACMNKICDSNCPTKDKCTYNCIVDGKYTNIDINYDGIADIQIGPDKDGKYSNPLNKKVGNLTLNQDTNNDGWPDLNIDINNDGIPDAVIDDTGSRYGVPDGVCDRKCDIDEVYPDTREAACKSLQCQTPTVASCAYDQAVQHLEYPQYTSDGRGGVTSRTVRKNSEIYGSAETHGCVCDITKEGTTTSKPCTIVTPEQDYASKNYSARAASAKRDLENAQQYYKNLIKEFNECTTWTSDILFDTTATYDYDETYLSDFGLTGRMDRTVSAGGGSEWFCNSRSDGANVDVNDTYTECKNNNTSTGAAQYDVKHYVYCDTDSCSTTKADSEQNISKVKFKKYTSTVEANYQPATLFYNIYPTGKIDSWANYEGKPDNEQIGVPLENELPVALSTPRGIYNYVVKFDKLGEFYETNSLGRFAGSSASIIPDSNSGITYACSYLVNMALTSADVIYCDDSCDNPLDCPGECVGLNCDPPCDGTDCIADCVGIGCIYDSDTGSSLLERTVSLNNMFPNGTDAYNWTNDKGQETISEIQDEDKSNGNAIYDEEPILSVTITPSVSSAIRKYNKDQESNGGYSNLTLSCYDLGGFGEAACYSSFIDSLLSGTLGGKAVNSNSKIANSSYRTGTDVSGKAGEYFEMWHRSFSEESMIGPSWK